MFLTLHVYDALERAELIQAFASWAMRYMYYKILLFAHYLLIHIRSDKTNPEVCLFLFQL